MFFIIGVGKYIIHRGYRSLYAEACLALECCKGNSTIMANHGFTSSSIE